MTNLDALNEPHSILESMRKAADNGWRELPMSKYTEGRARWLRECYNRSIIDVQYWKREYAQIPESIKREVEGTNTVK